MKIYELQSAPNPLKVSMFLIEKQLEVKKIQIDVRNRENLDATFLSLNPKYTVPCLVTSDGLVITESIAICRYFEAKKPLPFLFGKTPQQIGKIEMWQRKIDFEGYQSVMESLRNTAKRFVNRAVPDNRVTQQISELGPRGKMLTERFIEDMEENLNNNVYVAGKSFSIADISFYILLYFADWISVKPSLKQINIRRWIKLIEKRKSAQFVNKIKQKNI